MIVLLGAMAQPQLMAALELSGSSVLVTGRLTGGAQAGVVREDWPVLGASGTPLPGISVQPTWQLDRYAAVMGLVVQTWGGVQVIGVTQRRPQGGTEHVPDADRDALAAQIAQQILAADPHSDPEQLAWRLPMTGIWAASRLRAQAMAPWAPDVVPLRPTDAVRVLDRSQPFAGYFGVERQVLTHSLHLGGQTAPITREAFVMGDAAVLLPWDPWRDRVLVIEQFRFAPALRGDPQPWLLEPIAGRVDAGETPQIAILREAREEAALQITRLIPAINTYPSPGAVCEFLYHFVGIADLPDDAQGIHGLEAEAEDIRSHLLDRTCLSALVAEGQIANGPLALLSLWLDAQADRLRQGQEPQAR